jgi:glycosyltransferase involved in cell wall biosynthesis
MNILILYGTHEAPAIQDIYFNNPFKILEKKGQINFNLVEIGQLLWKDVYEYNLVIVSRIFNNDVLDLIEFCKKAKKPILFFFDDDILNFPMEYYLNHEPFYKNNEKLILSILKNSDGLVVSTERLKESYLKLNSVIYVTPPCLNINLLETHKPSQEEYIPVKRFTIGYAGSFGHVIDFRFMEKALLNFYLAHFPHISIEFMGCIPEAFNTMIDNDSIRLVHWQPDYTSYLKNILNAKWDIALCPVIDSDYTNHKTNIKFLEYSASKIPGIYSNIKIYAGDIAESKNGFLANNDYTSWHNKLEFAFNNRQILPGIAEAAHQFVIDKYADSRSADRWVDIIRNYRKHGREKLSEEVSIRLHKVKRLYSSKGPKGIYRKLRQLFYRYFLPKLLNRPVKTAAESEKDVIFSKLTKNFDKKVIKKQVLFIVPWLSVGGGDMVNLTIARGLDHESFSFHFITTEHSKHEWEKYFRRISRNIFHIRKVLPESKHFWEYNNLILDYIERANIDVILVSNSAIGYTCIPAIREKFSHIKIIDILHGQGGAKEGGGFPEYSAPYDSFIDTRVTINEYLRDFMTHKYRINARKIKVIHNCIDTDKYKGHKNGQNGRLTVSYIGRLSYEKHPEKVIEIAERLMARSPGMDISFRIVGDGPLYGELDRRVINKKLTQNIRMAGYKSDIKSELDNTDILILCSEMEGLPIVLLEAMSMSVACIASNVGGIPELIEDGKNGYLVDYGEDMVNTFADRIETLYKDKSLRQMIGSNARKKIMESFSIQNMSKAYSDLLS